MRLFFLILLILPGLAHAQQRGANRVQERASIPSWYAEIKGGAVFSDTDLPSDDGSLVALAVGRNLSAKWAVEVEAIKDSTDFDAGFQMDRKALQVNLVQFNREPLWNPYFLVGLGAQHYEVQGEDDTDVLVSVAVGGLWSLNNRGLMLRADARYRYSLLESPVAGVLEKGEPVFTLGLVIPLAW